MAENPRQPIIEGRNSIANDVLKASHKKMVAELDRAIGEFEKNRRGCSNQQKVLDAVIAYVNALRRLDGAYDELLRRATLIVKVCSRWPDYARAVADSVAGVHFPGPLVERSIKKLTRSSGVPLFRADIDQNRADIKQVLRNANLSGPARQVFNDWLAACDEAQDATDNLEVDGCWFLLHLAENRAPNPPESAGIAKELIESFGRNFLTNMLDAGDRLLVWASEQPADVQRSERRADGPLPYAGQVDLKGERFGRLHRRFMDGSERFPHLRYIAASGHETCPEWPQVPHSTLAANTIGLNKEHWLDITNKRPDTFFVATSEQWLEIEGRLWQGAFYFDGQIADQRDHDGFQRQSAEIQEAIEQFERLATESAGYLGNLPAVHPGVHFPREPEPWHRWLEAVCESAQVEPARYHSFDVRRVPGNIFLASAILLEHLKEAADEAAAVQDVSAPATAESSTLLSEQAAPPSPSEQVQPESQLSSPGYFGLRVDDDRRAITRAGFTAVVNLQDSRIKWAIFKKLAENRDVPVAPEAIVALWEEHGTARKPSDGTVNDAVGELRTDLKAIGLTIKVKRMVGRLLAELPPPADKRQAEGPQEGKVGDGNRR